jgi:hypothetical protein
VEGPLPTAGCGKDPGQPLGEWTQYFVPLSGETLAEPHYQTEREIFVRLPPDYDPSTPYRIVYVMTGCGALDGMSAAYPLWDAEQGGNPSAIYVALSLPNPAVNNNCYDNRAGAQSIEWESLDHDHAFVADRFCIDENKVYAGGYSSGAWLANMWSCYFGGIPEPPRKFLPKVALRGIMAVAGCVGCLPACNNGPVAGLWIHDEYESGSIPIECAHAQRDRLLLQNGCTDGTAGPTVPWGEDWLPDNASCAKYTACPAEYPVVFCTTVGRNRGSANDIAVPGFNRLMDESEGVPPRPLP